MESCVPPGFRFHPTDEELVGYYLRKKVASQKIDLDVIREVDLYRIEPWDLKETCREEGWVVCRAFKKRTTTPTKTARSWLDKGSYFNDEPSSTSSTINPRECISTRPTQQEYLPSQLMCKQEVVTDRASAADDLSFFNDPDDYFLHMPHLEGPSMPLIKSKAARSNVDSHCRNTATDWRALDKFVASQLSQEEKLYEIDVEPTMSSYQDRVAASFLLLEDEGDDEDGKLSAFLSSSTTVNAMLEFA
ncbi:hypothetical protein MLD38_004702 [Melastoma candidum]|uniref:Uncharacterized protein n=1 Tax=Melastoma candidum TaxID=119954 RepID=A0ACB9S8F0_9MYRT|nr:hypothetical protein MLD38_004702 [Melastoma candidum]